jgi:hypothetical protein
MFLLAGLEPIIDIISRLFPSLILTNDLFVVFLTPPPNYNIEDSPKRILEF